MSATDKLASSDEIHAYLVARLNDTLRRPGMWGGELAIQLTLDHLLFVESRQGAWDDERRALERREASPPTGVAGAFEHFLPTGHDTRVASVYAEFAHRQGWLKLDRALSAEEYATMLAEIDTWAAQDRVWADVTSAFGVPSVLFGSTNPYYGKTLGYATADRSTPMLFFHLWNGTDPDTKPSWPPSHEQPLLLAARRGDAPFTTGFTFTPEGRRRRPAQDE
ncbi:hypothetical protein [Kitasatospora aureofaciens]|uniref:hypothetical protein n=1 Tax=Kitasatospora aureofaciens TaxID=1894 RepID=UPI000526D155|nr:hypothetical protein [Kitasatospora aureofaciens]